MTTSQHQLAMTNPWVYEAPTMATSCSPLTWAAIMEHPIAYQGSERPARK